MLQQPMCSDTSNTTVNHCVKSEDNIINHGINYDKSRSGLFIKTESNNSESALSEVTPDPTIKSPGSSVHADNDSDNEGDDSNMEDHDMKELKGGSDDAAANFSSQEYPDHNGQHHPIAEFLYQLTKMLMDDNTEIIEWSDGRIKVHHPERLESEVLHKYFRHSKFASFQRQLNYFGFRKIAGKGKMSPCSYVNEAATSDIRSLLLIKRKTNGSAARKAAMQQRAAEMANTTGLMGQLAAAAAVQPHLLQQQQLHQQFPHLLAQGISPNTMALLSENATAALRLGLQSNPSSVNGIVSSDNTSNDANMLIQQQLHMLALQQQRAQQFQLQQQLQQQQQQQQQQQVVGLNIPGFNIGGLNIMGINGLNLMNAPDNTSSNNISVSNVLSQEQQQKQSSPDQKQLQIAFNQHQARQQLQQNALANLSQLQQGAVQGTNKTNTGRDDSGSNTSNNLSNMFASNGLRVQFAPQVSSSNNNNNTSGNSSNNNSVQRQSMEQWQAQLAATLSDPQSLFNNAHQVPSLGVSNQIQMALQNNNNNTSSNGNDSTNNNGNNAKTQPQLPSSATAALQAAQFQAARATPNPASSSCPATAAMNAATDSSQNMANMFDSAINLKKLLQEYNVQPTVSQNNGSNSIPAMSSALLNRLPSSNTIFPEMSTASLGNLLSSSNRLSSLLSLNSFLGSREPSMVDFCAAAAAANNNAAAAAAQLERFRS